MIRSRYTEGMKTAAATIRTRQGLHLACSLIAAAMLVAMLVAQLYHFDDFDSVLALSSPVMDNSELKILAGLIVIVELLALPYLLGMYLSKLMFVTSSVAAIIASMFWFMTALVSAHSSDTGMVGGVISVPGGLLAFTASLLLIAMVGATLFYDARART